MGRSVTQMRAPVEPPPPARPASLRRDGKRRLESCGRLCSMSDRIDRITRSELYAAIWNQPVTAVAGTMGVWHKALRKASPATRTPPPPRGYWARIAAGQTSKRPGLPPPKPGEAAEYRVDRARQTRQTDDLSAPQGV